MKRKQVIILAILISTIIIITVACRLPNYFVNASAKVVMVNENNASRTINISPTIVNFGLKIYTVFLSEGKNREGYLACIYQNPQCPDNTYEQSGELIKEYLDMSKGSNEVNTQLNAQERQIYGSTFSYIDIDVANSGNILSWGDGNFIKEETKLPYSLYEFELESPITVNENGQKVIVEMHYDLSNCISYEYTNNASYNYYDASNNRMVYFSMPEIFVTAYSVDDF